MILNSFALLDAFVSLLRLAMACTLTGLSAWEWCTVARESAESRGRAAENRRCLIVLMAVVLLGLNVVAWPLLYALLQSYVSQWPGVMCIYGVTRIGAGSDGSSRFLPEVLTVLQMTKPTIVFLSGAWLVLYLENRYAPSKLLDGRMLSLIVLLGGFSVADAGLEGVYLVIPKSEHFLEAGCCSLAANAGNSASDTPSTAVGAHTHSWMTIAYFIVTGLIIISLGILLARGKPPGRPLTTCMLLVALVSLPVSAEFLIHVASPAVLRLPHHHCAYCLNAAAPESLLGIVSFFLGCFSIGWLALLSWSSTVSGKLTSRLLFLAFFGYTSSLAMFSAELLCA